MFVARGYVIGPLAMCYPVKPALVITWLRVIHWGIVKMLCGQPQAKYMRLLKITSCSFLNYSSMQTASLLKYSVSTL